MGANRLRSLAHNALSLALLAAVVCLSAFAVHPALARNELPNIRVGAIYPLSTGGEPAADEYHGLLTAVRLVNAAGGVRGRHITLRLINVARRDDAPAAVSTLKAWHASIIMGSAESLVGVPASQATQQAGLIYWEDGSVATMLTQKGNNDVFRTVTNGQTLGRAAAAFAASTIAPRLHIPRHKLRVAVIHIVDIYGSSVAAAQIAGTRQLGMNLVKVVSYYATNADWPKMVHELKAAHPDVILVAAYLQDAVAFRKETIRQKLHVGAMIGTSSSFCMMPFAHALGRGAIGLFASDKPDTSINEKALLPAARSLRHRVAAKFHKEGFGASMSGPALAGFVGGWVLFHTVLPRAASITTPSIRKAALAVNLPYGSEINGAGVRFAGPNAPDAGQNLRATSVIWQWQHVDKAVILWPHAYATGRPHFIPLPLNPK